MYDLDIYYGARVCRGRMQFMQNFIKLNSAVDELSC